MTVTEELDFVLDFLYQNKDTSHAVGMTLYRLDKMGIRLATPLKTLLNKLVQDGYCDVSQTHNKKPFNIYRISVNGIKFYEGAKFTGKPYQSLENFDEYKIVPDTVKNMSLHRIFEETKQQIRNKCLECIKSDGYVRLGYVIEKEFGLNEPPSFYKSIAAKFTNSGKYIATPIVYNNKNDFDIYPTPKKPLRERYWPIYEIIKAAIIITLTLLINRTWPPKDSQSNTPNTPPIREDSSIQTSPLQQILDSPKLNSGESFNKKKAASIKDTAK